MTPEPRVIKETLNGQYGNVLRKETPLNYLRRLSLLNQYDPRLDIRVPGIVPGLAGSHKIITEMAFIEGTRPRQSAIDAKLRTEGSAAPDGGDMLNWKNEAMGLRMLDAHTGNWIQTLEGGLAPIDIYLERLGEDTAPGSPNVR